MLFIYNLPMMVNKDFHKCAQNCNNACHWLTAITRRNPSTCRAVDTEVQRAIKRLASFCSQQRRGSTLDSVKLELYRKLPDCRASDHSSQNQLQRL